MSDQYGSDFMTIVDEDGTEFELEVLSTLEYDGCTYMAVIPAGILIYMNLSSPEYMAVLYENSAGHLMMAGALAAYAAALILGRKILDIRV